MNPLIGLGQLGQSVWYDYITRDLMASGELARLITPNQLAGLRAGLVALCEIGTRLQGDDLSYGP